MTENRRSKNAIRSRMAQTGEKYTKVRRALLTADSGEDDVRPNLRRVTIADDYLAELGAHQAAWDFEQAVADLAAIEALPEELREVQLLRAAAEPVMWVVIKLPSVGFPGTDLDTDAGWAAMMAVTGRNLLTLQRAGIEAGLTEDHLRLIDVIESNIGLWPEIDWTAKVRAHVQQHVDARDQGRQRGQQASPQQALTPPKEFAADMMLRHPTDHYFSRARASMTDPAVVAYLDQQIAAFAPSYAALATEDWSSAEAQAELVIELQFSEPVPVGWKVPVLATVVGIYRGSVSIGSQVGLRLVADPLAPFNGTLLSVLTGERWLVCGTQLHDGTILPSDGTRRLRSG